MSENCTATVESTANIAFIKYWGAEDLAQALPKNPSISMTLTECRSRCRAQFFARSGQAGSGRDEVLLEQDGELRTAPESFQGRIRAHLDRLKEWAGVEGHFRIETSNSFPAASGMASSASGFSALTVAVTQCLRPGVAIGTDELSDLARQSGSGSASRSIEGGYVEWPARPGVTFAGQIAPASHWDLRDVIAVVETGTKEISSLEGHRRALSSPYYQARQLELPRRLDLVRTSIKQRDFAVLGPIIEEEGIDLHLIAMSSKPAVYYWKPETLEVLQAVRRLRQEGTPAWSTMDAGANVHVICEPASEAAVVDCLESISAVSQIIRDRVGEGPLLVEPDGTSELLSRSDPSGNEKT